MASNQTNEAGLSGQSMSAADVLLYVQAKYPKAMQSPVAQAIRAATDPTLDEAVEYARQCLRLADGWDVETLGHNIETNFPELEPEQCDDIAAAMLKVRS
jgi:hypothetical protein